MRESLAPTGRVQRSVARSRLARCRHSTDGLNTGAIGAEITGQALSHFHAAHSFRTANVQSARDMRQRDLDKGVGRVGQTNRRTPFVVK